MQRQFEPVIFLIFKRDGQYLTLLTPENLEEDDNPVVPVVLPEMSLAA